MNLLVDVCLTPEWISYLTAHDISAIHWSTIGNLDVEDHIIFDYATEHNYIILTHDLDFGALLSHTRSHKPSIIQARVDNTTPEFLGTTLLQALKQFEKELQTGTIITILPNRTKVRILPI
ncbi:MAG: DUF5615 family PIN-like protein [Verrucomicrobiia bacterium]